MTFESFSNVLAWIGVASPFLLFGAFDKFAKKEIKSLIAKRIFGNPSGGIEQRISEVLSLINASISSSIVRKIASLSIISLMSILFIYSMQYIYSRDSFDEVTGDFIESILSLNIFSILSLLAFVIVDVVSFQQTLIFTRLAVNCKNMFEIAFLAIADIATSLVLIVLLLPLLLYVIQISLHREVDREVYLQLVDDLKSQPPAIADYVLFLVPYPRQVDEKKADELKAITAENGWFVSAPDLYVAPATGVAPTYLHTGTLKYLAGSSLYYFKGSLSANEIAREIASLLKSNPKVLEAEVVSAEDGILGDTKILFKIRGKSTLGSANPFAYYPLMMNQINFFGTDFSKLYELGTKSMNENDIFNIILLNRFFDNMSNEIFFVCGKADNVRYISYASFLSGEFSECEEMVAMSGSVLNSVSELFGYVFEDAVDLPILPTSLSSLYMTFAIYVSIFIWIMLPRVGALAERFAEGGFSLVENHPFKIGFLFFVVFLYGPYLLISSF